ncbi:MAG: YdcF family protein [Alphaproteobacteria bacterium]|nr:YdcF family protein [Alphaproteobacteria bacterium]
MMLRYVTFLCVLLLILAALLWTAGFVRFVDFISAYQEPAITEGLTSTDAAIVLTGGSERVDAGLKLLKAGFSRKLFISGVYPNLKMEEIFPENNVDPDLRACCIELGHNATNTLGNAIETQAFMEREGYSSMRLVTANYHMPRSVMLLRHQMPEMRIIPHPVVPEAIKLQSWWLSPKTFFFLAMEYSKYLYAKARLIVEGWL